MTGALENIDNRPTLRFERRYEHGVERVWRAITDPDELRHWFPPGEELEVTESEPPRLLAGSWYGDELRFELRPDGEGCVLVFTHAFDDRNKAARDAAGWDRCFVRLEALLRGEPMSEKESLEGWPEVHERYAAEFGVDPALGRQALAEHGSQR
jgi:uncharacterized protein YndB with AHSA1/START domain